MRKFMFCLLAAGLLQGCGEPASSVPGRNPGRFAGIGVFDAGQLWAEMTDAPNPSDDAAARIADDEHIIVVIDTHTGEVRQCGDLSGYCIAMKPWSGSASPVTLNKHAADLMEEGPIEEIVAPQTAAPR
jgi:hypothetical protein